MVAPQKILIGYAETVSTATSEKDCIQQCSNSQARFGFHCQSGLFYYQVPRNICSYPNMKVYCMLNRTPVATAY